MVDMVPPLAANGCRSQCSWRRTEAVLAGERLFRCSGCGSEWVASEPWMPADADGTVRPEVLAEKLR